MLPSDDDYCYIYQPAQRHDHEVLIRALPPSNIRLGDPEHVNGGLIQLDKHPVEDLAQTQQLQNFANLWADTIDTKKKKKYYYILLSDNNMQVSN